MASLGKWVRCRLPGRLLRKGHGDMKSEGVGGSPAVNSCLLKRHYIDKYSNYAYFLGVYTAWQTMLITQFE